MRQPTYKAPTDAGAAPPAETPAKPKKPKKEKKPASNKKAVKKPAPNVERFERLDMRLSKAEKAKITAKAKKLRRTITSVVLEAIEKIR